MSRSHLRHVSRRLVALAAVLLVLLTGCNVDVHVDVVVADDGSGEVRVAAALDEAAADRVPQLADQLEVADLVATGWSVTGPAVEGDGRTWLRAAKPFASVEAASAVLDEVSGAEGPFGDLAVRRAPSLLQDRWHVDGTVDLTDGLAAFSDEGLRARLDGTDVGLSDEELAAEAGVPLEEAVTFSVAVDLPGEVRSNGEDGPSRAVWRPVLGQALDVTATGSRLNTTVAVLLGVAATAAVALVLLLARRWRRRGPSGRERRVVGTVGR